MNLLSNTDSLISSADVAYVAKLAHLSFDEQQAQDMAGKLGSILEYMQQLNEIDTTGVELTTHVLPINNVFREDVPGVQLSNDQALANAPEREDNFFRVPRIL